MELSHEIEAGLHKNHKTVQKVFWLDYRGTLAHSSSDCDTFPTFFRLESAEKWVPGALYTFLY